MWRSCSLRHGRSASASGRLADRCLGGVSLQLTGSYATVWIATVVVGYAAAAVNLPIRYRAAVATA